MTAFVLAALALAVASPSASAGSPTMAMIYPTANSIVDKAVTPTIRLQASVTSSDPLLNVTFLLCPTTNGSSCGGNVTVVGGAGIAPYQADWTPVPSPANTALTLRYLVWLQVDTAAGATYQSPSTSFTLLQPPPSPSVKLVAPAASVGFVGPASPLLYATASPGATVPASSIARVDFLDGPSVIGTITSPNAMPSGYAFLWTGASPGAHLVAARATDTLGDSATSSTVPLYVIGADQAPAVNLSAPISGQLYGPGSVVALAATATSGTRAIQRVEFVAGNTVITTVYSPPYVGSWINPPDGNWAVVARAFDDLGLASASPAAFVQVLAAPRPPSVVLTAPTAGSTVPANAPLALGATAISPDSSIGRVDFYAGSTLVGSAAASPYSVNWGSPVAGAQTLTARAIDVNGSSVTSAPVTVSVGSGSLPAVTLTAPTSGASFTAPATIDLNATASVAGGTITEVEFLANGNVVATTTAPPYSYRWTGVAAGAYTLAARATTNLAAVRTSTTVSANVANGAPVSVALTAPASGARYAAGQAITISARATASSPGIQRVDFYADAIVLGSVNGGGAAQVAANFTVSGLASGNHALSATAVTVSGASAISPATNIVVTGLTVAMTTPASGQTLPAGLPIALTASAAENGGTIKRVDFYAGSTLLGSTSAAPYGVTWPNPSAGNYVLTARATDTTNAVATSAPVSVTIAAVGLIVTSPTNGATIAADFTLVEGTFVAPDNSGITVNGQIANNDGLGNFFVNNLPLAPGANSLVVKLTMPDGNVVTQTVNVQSAGAAPFQVSVDIDAGFDAIANSVFVSNRGTVAIARVDFLNFGTGTVQQQAAGNKVATMSFAAPGVYRPSVRITDTAGRQYLQRLPILVQSSVQVDRARQSVWRGFSTALASGSKAIALQALTAVQRPNFGAIYDALAGHWNEIVSSLSPIGMTELNQDAAEYGVTRTSNGSKYIYFVTVVRDSDGVWRLDSF